MNLTDVAVASAVALVVVDGLMTLPFWHLEGNPVVLSLGPGGMLSVKLTAASALLWVWFGDAVDTTHVASKACAWCLTALYGLVVMTNGLVMLAYA